MLGRFGAAVAAGLLALGVSAAHAQVAVITSDDATVVFGHGARVITPTRPVQHGGVVIVPPTTDVYVHGSSGGQAIIVDEHRYATGFRQRFIQGGIVISGPGQVAISRGVDVPAVHDFRPDLLPHHTIRRYEPVRRDLGSDHPVYRFYYGR